MGIRKSLANMFGAAPPPQVTEALEVAGMTDTRPFTPGSPLTPADGYGNTPRSRDFLTGVNIVSRPRINEQVAFSTLKGMIGAYDIAQICIWHRIDSLRSFKWHLTPKPGFTGDAGSIIDLGHQVLDRPDRETLFSGWLAKYLFDIFAYDAGCLYKLRNNAGRVIGLRVLDGTTIAPLLDYWGNRPQDPAPAFVQFAQGIPWEWLPADDIIYEPFRPRSDTMYGKAPLETILLNANTDLRFQSFFLNHFTEGNIPEGFAGSPEGWTPDQISSFQEKWDALLYGDDTQKHQIKWVPWGTKFDWTKESAFSDKFSLHLMRKTSAAYSIVPSDMGFTENVNRSSGETQADVQFRIGDQPIISHIESILSRFLQHDLGLPLEFGFETGREVEDRLATAQAHKIYIDAGVIGASEVREDVYGLDEPNGVPVPRFIMTTRSGPVPLSALYAVAGPIDKDSGAPLPGAPLPHKPFLPIEGVTPQKPPNQPPLAVKLYPADNPGSAAAGVIDANAPVLKEAASGVTVTGGTVAPGNPMLEEEEEPEEQVVKAEMAAFGRYTRGRSKSGKWRDFAFAHLPARRAMEANRMGRALVRKEAGLATVAGLCVRAADTGRVLMLQRALDPDDPAGSMWEFPGGHMEEGEDIFSAALREWCEETGCPPPVEGSVVGQWTNGIYAGIVLEVPTEADIAINPDVPHLANPDDPDGDIVETVAWWEPAQLSGNPAIRAELVADLPLVMDALGYVAKAAIDMHSELVRYHAPEIVKGMRAMVTHEQIQAAVAAYLARPNA